MSFLSILPPGTPFRIHSTLSEPAVSRMGKPPGLLASMALASLLIFHRDLGLTRIIGPPSRAAPRHVLKVEQSSRATGLMSKGARNGTSSRLDPPPTRRRFRWVGVEESGSLLEGRGYWL
ncbi:hypothetical protein B0H13DRAFT_1857200 [Mycena leptocephala]|nr:hypothetical protein B0H13DRAFT_1857200 [Mycena leptocephala]